MRNSYSCLGTRIEDNHGAIRRPRLRFVESHRHGLTTISGDEVSRANGDTALWCEHKVECCVVCIPAEPFLRKPWNAGVAKTMTLIHVRMTWQRCNSRTYFQWVEFQADSTSQTEKPKQLTIRFTMARTSGRLRSRNDHR